jgi:hypothetical protein
MARRVKLSIVKIGEFHTDTRFGKEEKKRPFPTGSRPFQDSVSSLEEFLGGFLSPSIGDPRSRPFPFKCAQTRKTVIWAIGEKGIHVTAHYYRFCQSE